MPRKPENRDAGIQLEDFMSTYDSDIREMVQERLGQDPEDVSSEAFVQVALELWHTYTALQEEFPLAGAGINFPFYSRVEA